MRLLKSVLPADFFTIANAKVNFLYGHGAMWYTTKKWLVGLYSCKEFSIWTSTNLLKSVYENYDFDLSGDVLYIYKGETKCFREHHDIDSVTATVYDRRGGTVDINVNCCCDCHKYFISESEFSITGNSTELYADWKWNVIRLDMQNSRWQNTRYSGSTGIT